MIEKPDQWAVLFDLDETLVLTSRLETLRRTRDWQAVYAAFDQTALPQNTTSSLKRLSEAGHRIGIITKSPRAYATRLVQHHALNIPVLVAYHDVQRHKPHPESLLKAASGLSIPPCRCIYVGDHQDDVIAARAAGFRVIGVCWGESTGALDIEPVCKRWEDILSEVERITAGVDEYA
jgi:HAD superfamily hydrolase (TIGR01662 family)